MELRSLSNTGGDLCGSAWNCGVGMRGEKIDEDDAEFELPALCVDSGGLALCFLAAGSTAEGTAVAAADAAAVALEDE